MQDKQVDMMYDKCIGIFDKMYCIDEQEQERSYGAKLT